MAQQKPHLRFSNAVKAAILTGILSIAAFLLIAAAGVLFVQGIFALAPFTKQEAARVFDIVVASALLIPAFIILGWMGSDLIKLINAAIFERLESRRYRIRN